MSTNEQHAHGVGGVLTSRVLSGGVAAGQFLSVVAVYWSVVRSIMYNTTRAHSVGVQCCCYNLSLLCRVWCSSVALLVAAARMF